MGVIVTSFGIIDGHVTSSGYVKTTLHKMWLKCCKLPLMVQGGSYGGNATANPNYIIMGHVGYFH